MFGKLKKGEKEELEELRKKEIARLENDVEVLKKCINVTSKALENSKNLSGSLLVMMKDLNMRVERLEDKEIDEVIDKEIMYY